MPSTCMSSIRTKYSSESRLRRCVTKQRNEPDDVLHDAVYRWQPEMKHLCSKLLSIGGQEVDFASLPDRDLPILLSLGERFTGTTVRVVRQGGSSYRNVAHLWLERTTSIIAIGMGYALASNRIWYPHAWGIEDEALLETTEIQIDYYGRYITENEASTFAKMHAVTSATP